MSWEIIQGDCATYVELARARLEEYARQGHQMKLS